MDNKNKPVFQARKELVSASLFEREAEGEKGTFKSFSVALNISYKKDGEFVQKSITIVKSNLQKVIDVLEEVKAKLPSFSSK